MAESERRQSGRKSSRRKSSRRKSSRRKSSRRKSSKRQSMRRGSKRGSGSISRGINLGKAAGDQKKRKSGSAQETPWIKAIREHVKTNLPLYQEYFKEILKKKDVFVNDCKTGRKNFVNWLADTFRSVGLHCDQKKMPGNDLPVYGPEGCPDVLYAWNVKQMPKKWTLCFIGNFDIAEPQVKDPSLLLDGRFIPGRYKPENWGVLATWLSTLKILSNITVQWPINLKIVYTANQADDAVSLIRFVSEQKEEFFGDVDFFCVCTTLGHTGLPAGVVYGGRGACHFVLEISSGKFTDICSCLTGPGRQAANDTIIMLERLQEDCVYTYLNVVEPFKLPSDFETIARRAFVRDMDPELGHWFKPSVIKKKEKDFIDMWKPEVKIESINSFPKNGHLYIPGTLVTRFAVKYMSETAPCRVEEMVNRLLRKKWDTLDSEISCRLSMDYWSRPWMADCENQLIKMAKRSISNVFHVPAVESFDLTPNPLLAVLEILIGKETIVLSLASMLDLGKPSLKTNFVKNIKTLILFMFSIQKATTKKEYLKKFEKQKEQVIDVWDLLNDIEHTREKTKSVSPPVLKPRSDTLKSLHVI